MTQIPRDDFCELFNLQVRGGLAAAYLFSGKQPSADHWELLRGERIITMRDIGEAGYYTGYTISLNMSKRAEPEDSE